MEAGGRPRLLKAFDDKLRECKRRCHKLFGAVQVLLRIVTRARWDDDAVARARDHAGQRLGARSGRQGDKVRVRIARRTVAPALEECSVCSSVRDGVECAGCGAEGEGVGEGREEAAGADVKVQQGATHCGESMEASMASLQQARARGA